MTAGSGLRAAILLADDGELDDVRGTLRELGLAFERPGEETVPGSAVLISNARCALARAPLGARRPPFHIVVTERMSAVLRRELGRIRPDFVLLRPVDATLLRLLMQHALYAGPERRRDARVPMGAAVRCRVGRTSRPATLIEISEGGCRLETKGSFEFAQRLCVVLPPELTGAGTVELEARVVSATTGGSRRSERSLTSLAFQAPDPAARSVLRSVVSAAVANTGALRPRKPERAGPASPPKRACADEPSRPLRSGPPARRRSPRSAYRRPILASGAGSTHVLVGRNLSAGGMRVDHDPLLVVGQELKLVIHGTAGRAPVVVKATVARDEGSEGCVLEFRSLSTATRTRLEELVRELPGVRPADAGARGPNVVVSEVVELAG